MENHGTSRLAPNSTEELSGTSSGFASSSASTSFDILFEYEGSKQPLCVSREDVVVKIENQLGKLGYDITVCTVPSQEKETKKRTAVLQRWSTKWGCYVDSTENEMIDGDLVTIREHVCRPVDGQQSKDAAVSNAITICDRVGKKPTAATAQALKKLFPSSASTPAPVQRKRVFDPTADCVFTSEKKKKKAARCRGTMVNFVLLRDFEKGLPRKEARKQLMEGNCAKKIEIFRTMSADEVKTKVLQEFTTISTISYLQLNGGVRMAISSQQHLDGNEVITSAKKRNGNVVYITDQTLGKQVSRSNNDNSGASDGGNNVNVQTTGSTEETVVISSDDSEADVLPSFLYGSNKVQGDRRGIMAAEEDRRGNTAAEEDRSTMKAEVDRGTKENRMAPEEDRRDTTTVEENRRIRAMQDEEYEEMLREDQDKERTRAVMVAKNEKLVALQQRLQTKYSHTGSGAIKIVLKLPGSSKAERHFSLSDSTKDLYEYAFSLTGIEKFKIVKSFPPRCTISPNCTLSESQIENSCVLMMDTGADESVLDFLNGDEDSIPEVSVQESAGDLSTILMQAEKDCKEFITLLNTKFFPAHHINRSTILEDVIALFSTEDVLYHYPLKIHFIGERAIDTGGVCRDMFDEFWLATYAQHFEGSNLLVPSVNAHTDMGVMHALGRILSHGYIFCNVLPTRIVYPTLYACLVGVGAKVPAPILLGSFIDYLTTVEQSVVKMGLGVKASAFPIDLQTQLIGILDRFGSRKAPNPHNLRQLLIEAAEYEFLHKPLAAISSIHAGIPPQELLFWSNYTVAQFYTIFQCLTASPTKVLELIEEPVMLHAGEKRVFQFLQQFIGNISNEDVGHFLRFVTGSSVCPTKKIQITFNRVSGLARRPIAHTCAFTLEISTDYTNYMQFSSEMKAVLSDESSWFMDAL